MVGARSPSAGTHTRRVLGMWVPHRGGSPVPMPRFLASRVRPAPVRVPSCRVPARRFKDPGGVALPPPGSGGGRARRVSRSVCRLALPQTPRPPPLPPPLPRRCGRGVGGVCPEPPLGARGGSLRAPGLPVFRGPALSAVCACSRVDSRLFFRSPTLFFFSTRVSFRFSLAGLRLALVPPVSLHSLRREDGGRARGDLCAVVSKPREFAHIRNTDTTLSGGSLGSCVDEERS